MGPEIAEVIEVATVFKGGQAQPVAFRWHQNFFRIKRVNLFYKSRLGRDLLYFYSISSDKDDTFQISFNPNQLVWKLDQLL